MYLCAIGYRRGVHACILVYVFKNLCVNVCRNGRYGVATISRLLEIIGLFGRLSFLLLGSFAKETYTFK